MAFDLYTIPVTHIDGSVDTLSRYAGKVLLVVNVASKCGLTPQYDGLEKTYARFREAGLEVLAFPANDFAGQEPGSNEEIAQFCRGTFGTSFPMFSKISVVGPSKHPLYAALIDALPESQGAGKQGMIEGLIRFGAKPNREPELLWNFEKFLIGRDGKPLARFSPDTLPEDASLTKAIEAALQR
ncbi:MAG: glutathione peroxidase [Janthinobacterium lividum]